jgi:SAM-dependent methyltransferase
VSEQPVPVQQTTEGQYLSRAYNTKERFCSFWHQFDETLSLEPRTVLEVGPGAGLVTDWLRRSGIEVITLDLDPALEPDVQGSVTKLPFEDGSFDVVLCCEVLEHLPFDDSRRAMSEIARVSHKAAVISVPDQRPWIGLAYPLYFGIYAAELRQRLVGRGKLGVARMVLRREVRLRDVLFLAVVPARWGFGDKTWEARRPPVPHDWLELEFAGEHHWEIGVAGYPLDRFTEALSAAGLRVAREFRVPENPWHHFFVLRSTCVR